MTAIMQDGDSLMHPHIQIPRNDHTRCPICGWNEFSDKEILWQELIDSWELNEDEVRQVNTQQGKCCQQCGANLRSMTLAGALNEYLGWKGTLTTLVLEGNTDNVRLLEINEAGDLTKHLSQFRHYTFVCYPQFDMQKMDIPDNTYDIVIHSDTLEHVPDPIQGLTECLRIVRPGGYMMMTIPIVPTRLTRRRANLPPSYHGSPLVREPDLLVHTEYGADFYRDMINAGWRKTTVFTLGGLEALALIGAKLP